MKFFWKHKLLTLFCVMFLVFSFFVTPRINNSKVLAQTPSKTELMASGDKIFTDFLSTLQQNKTNPKGSEPSLQNAPQTQIDSYVAGIDALISSVQNAKSVFDQTFISPAAPSTNVYADYRAALLLSINKINQDQRSNILLRSNPLIRTKVTKISNDLRNASNEQISILRGDASTTLDVLSPNASATEALNIEKAVGTQRAAQVKQEQEEAKCTSIWNSSIMDCLSAGIEWIIKKIFLEIALWFFWLAATVLNYVIYNGIFEFAKITPDLYPIWLVVRKIVSLFVVFVGLWLGFMYILGKDEKFEKYVPWVVIFALFINFSYPLARTAIDMSNIVALKIYTATVGADVLAGDGNNRESMYTQSPGTIIMQKIGLAPLASESVNNEKKVVTSGGLQSVTGIPGTLMVIALIITASFTLFYAAYYLMLRTAVLIFLIPLSPFLFIDGILPVLGDKAMEVRKVFFSQLAVAPVFMLFFALSLAFTKAFSPTGTTAQVFFNIVMMQIMFFMTTKITKGLSDSAGKYVSNTVGKVAGTAMIAVPGGLAARGAMAGAGMLGRGTIGRAASKIRDSRWVTQRQGSTLGRGVYEMSNFFAKSSYDLRSSSVVAGGLKKAGLNAGSAVKAGYEEVAENKRQKVLQVADRIKTRYERDVIDSNGNIIHRKGDMDIEGQKAYERYVEKAGKGSLFASEEQKRKTREALAKKQEERFEKTKQESGKLASKELSDYNAIQSPILDVNGNILKTVQEQKKAFVEELKKDIENTKKIDPSLRGEHAQFLVKALNDIEKQQTQGEVKELEKAFNEIRGDIKNPDGTITTVETQRKKVIDSLKSKALELTQKGKSPQSEEVQTVAMTIKNLTEKGKKDDSDFALQLEEELERYQNPRGSNEQEKINNRERRLQNLSLKMQQALLERVGGKDTNNTQATNTVQEKSPILNQNGIPFKTNTSTSQASTPAPSTPPSSFAVQPIDYSKLERPAVDRKNNLINPDINLDTLEARSVKEKIKDADTPAFLRGYGKNVTNTPLPVEEGSNWQGSANATNGASDTINNASESSTVTSGLSALAKARLAAQKEPKRTTKREESSTV